MNVPVFSLGDRMAKARSHAGYSQQETADRLHISRVTLSRYESGERTPSKELVQALAEATGVPVEWFYQDTPASPPEATSALPDRIVLTLSPGTSTYTAHTN